MDFRFFWLAGTLWGEGIDPYSGSFRQIGAHILPPGNVVLHWFYPPQWWIVCRGLALMSLEQSVIVWRLLSGGIILLGTGLLIACVTQGDWRRRLILMGLGGGLALVVEPTVNLLALGQSSSFVYLSLVLLVVGVMRGQSWLVGLAVFLATFKPQLGALILLWALMLPSFRVAALAGLGGAGLFTLPHVLQFGPLVTVRAYLANLSDWGSLASNTPLTLSGPVNLLARLGVTGAQMSHQLLIAALFMLYAGWLLRKQSDRPAGPLLLLTAVVAALVPLHIYDLTILLIPIILYLALGNGPLWGALLAVILMIRPGQIERLWGIPQYGSGVSEGLIGLDFAALLLLALALREILQRPTPAVSSADEQEAFAE